MAGRGRPGAETRPWPDGRLVGRDDLLDELTAAAEQARGGTGSLVLLTGDAGIGKTSVVRRLVALVRDELAVSASTCVADNSAPAFWPWQGALSADESTRPPERARPGEAIGAQRFERLTELRQQLSQRAHRRPALHVIEDLQWADVASVLLMVHLGTVIVDVPFMVVGTLRTSEALTPPLEDAIEELRRSALVRAVAPLGSDEISALVRHAGIAPDPELVALVRERSGGNPLYVSELLRGGRGDDPEQLREALAGSVPSRVSELTAHRLARLPAAVADLVVVASIVGTDGDARTLAAVGAASVESCLDLLAQAAAAGLVDAPSPGRWQFRHDLVRDAVYGRVPPAVRARHHAAVLEVLAAEGAPAAVLAHHALAAQPLLDADRAVALAARAGQEAFDQHGYEEAVVWFDQALRAAPTSTLPRWRAELLVLCGEAHRHAGAIEAARRAFSAAAELTEDPALLARAALGYADPGADLGIAYRTDDPVTGQLLHRAIAAQPSGGSVALVLLEARLAAEVYFSDDPARSRGLARSAVEQAQRLGDLRALATATAVEHDGFVVGQADLAAQLRGSEQLLEWARATGSSGALLTAHRARVFDLLAAGDLAGVDAEVLAFRRVAEPLGAPGYLWWPALWAAMRALLEGRHDLAEARAMDAYSLGERPFPALALGNLSFLLFFLRREQGRLAEMEQATRDYVAAQPDIPAIRVGLALLLAELGREAEARGLLVEIREGALQRLHDRNWPTSWFQLARAAHLVGDRDLATTLLEERHRPTERCITVSLATVCLGATDLGVAWLLHTTGHLDAADEAYVTAAEVSSRIGARSWLAQTHVDHARLLLDRAGDGDISEARRLVDAATAAATDIGLGSVTPQLEELDRRLRGPRFEAGTAEPVTTTGRFQRAGALWDVAFAGRTIQLPHGRGLTDLAHLLSRPGEAVSVLELLDQVGPGGSGARGALAFDERARREIRARLHELDAEEAEAEADGDRERATSAREQRQQLAEIVTRDLGLGGRPRRIGDPVERARKTVSTRIRRAIAQIGRAHPELGRHLERSIDTGSWCAYRPAEPCTWST